MMRLLCVPFISLNNLLKVRELAMRQGRMFKEDTAFFEEVYVNKRGYVNKETDSSGMGVG